METNRICKGCTATVRISDDEINKAIDRLSKLRGMHFVDDSVYTSRLEQCKNCHHLEYGTTCLQCGCIVQIKAKLPESTCPYPKDSKW